MKAVLIIGSSRTNGNTSHISQKVAEANQLDVINLSDYNFSYYDYESNNINDDFIPLITKIIKNYDTFIFSTPIYWYNMSGIMKVFFDRFSDLIRIEKDLGRKLRGKNMMAIANSHAKEIDYDFFMPFRMTSKYLGINYLGDKYYSVEVVEDHYKIEKLEKIEIKN